MNGRRHANLTAHARRLTPVEVAQHWFRRGADFAKDLYSAYPDFPKPAPDGLYLLSQVEAWFDRLHGRKQAFALPQQDTDAAMRAANGQ